MKETLLKVNNLKKYFPTKKGLLHAVDGVNFEIKKGETLGIVGESGCGKSTTGRVVLRLIEATDGEILFEGKDIRKYSERQMRDARKEMQIVFQDPFASLNPRLSLSEIIGEPFEIFNMYKPKEREEKVVELMELVGLSERLVNTYPHELDGGRRQRVGVARALALNPKFIVCDEPVSALDVSIQAQILNLMQDLQEKLGLTYMFISHDLSVVKHISDRIAVMYLGKVVEITTSKQIFQNPLHPYTQALLSAIPIPKIGQKRNRIILEGDVPSPINPPNGCRFAGRCPYVMDKCFGLEPELIDVGGDHSVACHLVNK
ncbi:ABC transporter ATP-binding protein [Serpentinicella alkaliphila]|uniref:Peptide/nickel transport system ATP-binding protein/oligopeptide transport system ATP-binding protein n=1 Tax=Serpentinicella alkaliphila TaxID=1734049 RepID=A0A4R2TX40_9FIRM|nr:oligopeptide/dipeptide ABC transporter ATP-binding protein [Serpentinicella alkaliphila]QUH25763.1 ATP-binding cassette domain-containing protein [Serpentinicella alkaliphila]TCP99762.1 peptide/nickel transport system ATP-binding protein/oligopeptide transport system ATP-binding protein [Serpentinicella alkaliphila]